MLLLLFSCYLDVFDLDGYWIGGYALALVIWMFLIWMDIGG